MTHEGFCRVSVACSHRPPCQWSIPIHRSLKRPSIQHERLPTVPQPRRLTPQSFQEKGLPRVDKATYGRPRCAHHLELGSWIVNVCRKRQVGPKNPTPQPSWRVNYEKSSLFGENGTRRKGRDAPPETANNSTFFTKQIWIDPEQKQQTS